jgi:hypothetical protein
MCRQPMDIDQFDSQPEIKNTQSSEASITTSYTPCEESIDFQELKQTPTIRFVAFPSI